jgi:RING-type zinc-finger
MEADMNEETKLERWRSAPDANDVHECCICMNEYSVREEPLLFRPTDADAATSSLVDVEAGQGGSFVDPVVRIPQCGHFFHQQCIAGWVGGAWQPGDAGIERFRRAKRTTCPLCRKDLRPAALALTHQQSSS